jgi:hypothetical protein
LAYIAKGSIEKHFTSLGHNKTSARCIVGVMMRISIPVIDEALIKKQMVEYGRLQPLEVDCEQHSDKYRSDIFHLL